MRMDIVAGSGNDEFYTPRYAVAPLLKYLVGQTEGVWCPFDTDESLIVKTLTEEGHDVTATHLATGHDFFETDIPADAITGEACSHIVSNPPYSRKGQVFERLFGLGKPFAMLVGVVGLFESRARFDMFARNEFEIMWLDKRVAYFKSMEEQVPSLHPPFSSVWLTKGILPRANVFERIHRTTGNREGQPE